MFSQIEKLSALRGYLAGNILGQEEPIDEVTGLLQRSFCGLRYPGRPVASMLSLGPTGVGKTETVNLFTKHLFGSLDKLIRLDMSEFQNQSSLGLLIGTDMGEAGLFWKYCGQTEGSGVILFDEIEKAHPLVLNIFLQILSAARITLSDGNTLDLSNFVVVATANLGSQVLMGTKSTDRKDVTRWVIQAALAIMLPEMFARFDLRCVFNKLDWGTLNEISALAVKKCLEIINSQGHHIDVNGGVIEHIRSEGYDEKFGARPMEHAAMRILGDIVVKEVLRNGGSPVNGVVQYDRRENKCFLSGR